MFQVRKGEKEAADCIRLHDDPLLHYSRESLMHFLLQLHLLPLSSRI